MTKFADRKKIKGHRGHRKVECEHNQASVIINLYVKFNGHSSNAKTSHDAKSEGQTEGRTDSLNDDKFG